MIAFAILVASCNRVDDTRIPAAPVNIVFNDSGMWDVYGVGGAMQYKYFIKNEQPANFPWTISTYTGYGGVLLVRDFYGTPLAYDMACPVECRPTTRIFVDNTLNIAECPVCHSTYAIYENYGRPLSGLAAERGYGLRHYNVMANSFGGYNITR